MTDDTRRIENKIDRIMTDMVEVKVLQAEHGTQLKEHMRRANIMEARIVPVEKQVHMVNAGVKLMGFITVVAAVARGIHWMFVTL